MATVFASVAFLIASAPFTAPDAAARVYKCKDNTGGTQYSDEPCEGRPQTYQPRALNQIPSDQLTGGRKSSKSGGKDGWVSPLDPVANCEKQGGKFSREMRGCLLP